jgi:hypothetical protein
LGSFSPTAYNPEVGLPGAIAFEGYGPGHCNCEYANNYKYAFGPRLGLAWQLAPKTVLRAGAGLSYGRTPELGYLNSTLSNFVDFASPEISGAAGQLEDGIPEQYHQTWPNLYAGAYPNLPSLAPPPVAIDHNAGRPPRIFQWSFGIQRELSKSLLLDVAYVGNRGAWWQSGVMEDPNALTPQFLQSRYGLNINNASDRALLTTPLLYVQEMGSSYAARFPTPFAGFPMLDTLAQAISPFPQFTPINYIWAPLGRTWYDALQVNLTKRFATNFSFNYNLTWQRELTVGAETSYNLFATIAPQVNDVENYGENKYISGLSRPFMNVISLSYRTPKIAGEFKALAALIRDWQFSALLRYSSAYPIQVPAAASNIDTYLHRLQPTTYPDRVPGQPLFVNSQNGNSPIDLNCHCFDPSMTFVLNPSAWTEPTPGTFGTSTGYFNDYRGFRHPIENMGLARNFPIGRDGRINLQLRAEFNNIFNRTYLANPTSTNYFAAQSINANGQTIGGFGYINVLDPSTAANVRQGQVVARLSF